MKLKKLFAGIVAVAMMATMAMPSFAAKGSGLANSTVENKGQVEIKKTLVKEEQTMGEVPDSVTAKMTYRTLTVPTGVDASTVGIVSIDDATITKGVGNFKVHLPEYKTPGVYEYILTENATGVAGVVDNAKTYKLTVWAVQKHETSDDKGNDLQCKVRLDEVVLKDDKYVESDNTKLSKIENVYQAGTASVIKKVTGSDGDRTATFNFKVTLTSSKPVASKVTYAKDATDTGTFEWTKATVNGVDTWTATHDFTLVHGETMNIGNLPYDVSYDFVEMNGDKAVAFTEGKGSLVVGGKTYEVTYKDNSGTVGAKNKAGSATITNNCGSIIDTGVILDNAPYILMLTVVAAGAMTLVIKKRREEE